ncbi:Prohead protease [Glutamicibacter phage Montesquieu]|nr:Prohead protease [Glutamicibacter phage Montesquieu]
MANVRESAGVTTTGPGRMLIQLISPGQGSSGYYAPEVLEAAATDKVFPRGTQMHIDHDSTVETMDKPEGSLRNLAAVLQEDAYVDTNGNLVAEALVSSTWKTFLDEFKDFVGASINAAADIVKTSTGTVIERLIPHKFNRVDFVTVGGRDGKIIQVLESAREIAQNAVVSEAFQQDKSLALQNAVRSISGSYTWMTDFDDEFVVYEADEGLFRRSYTLDGQDAALGDDEVPVRRRLEYDPITLPSETAGVQENAHNSEEETVAKVEIEETELAQLREAASRVQAMETEATERAEREATEAKESRRTTATNIVKEAFGNDEVPALFTRIAEAAAAEETFDAEAFRTEVTEAAAIQMVESGAGTPRGLGDTDRVQESAAQTTVITDESITNALHGKA